MSELNEIQGIKIAQKRKELKITKEILCEKWGINPSTLYRWEHGKVEIPKSKHAAILDFLKNGIVKDSDASVITVKGVDNDSPYYFVDVPLVSQYAYGGYLSGFSDPEYVSALPTIPFMADREMTGNYVAFEVRGDSMDDGTKFGFVQGEVVICREVERNLWKDCKLHYNKRDFVIVHEEGILIKRIIAHDVGCHTITIHSLNPEYPDRTINLAEVKQIFSVVTSQLSRGR